MNVHYTARHLLLPPELKVYADKRLGGLGRLLEASAEADLVISAEKNRLRAEIQIRGKRDRILVIEEGHDLSAVLNEAFDVLEKKLKKERENSGRKNAAADANARPWESRTRPPPSRRRSFGSNTSRPNRCPSRTPSSNSLSGRRKS
jgi:ribosomal subunit interface protein